MRVQFILFFFSIAVQANAQSIGSKYHQLIRKAESFTKLDSRLNFDSAFYYYDRAIDLNTSQYDKDLLFISNAIWYGDFDRAQRYILNGASHQMSWKDAKIALKWAKYMLDTRSNLRGFNAESIHDLLTEKTKFRSICSKKSFRNAQSLNSNEDTANELQKVLKKVDRIDQKGGRKNTEKLAQLDAETYNLVYDLIVGLGRIPTEKEVGYEGHEILSVVLMHFSAEQILSLLPYFLKAINEGSYLFNEDLSYAIDRCAIFENEYIIVDKGKFKIVKDTSYNSEQWGNFSYLGELYFPNKIDSIKSRCIQPYAYPFISEKQINAMRDTLCLSTIGDYMISNKVSYVDSSIFQLNMLIFNGKN